MSWLDRINPQVHVVWSGKWEPGYVEPLRTNCDHELIVFSEGTCEMEVEGRALACPAESFVIVPAGKLHLTRARHERVYRYCVHFDWTFRRPAPEGPVFSFWPDAPRRGAVRPAPAFVPKGLLSGTYAASPSVADVVQTMALRWRSGGKGPRRSCRALLLEVLLLLLSPPAGGEEKRDRSSELAFRVRDLLDRVDVSETSVVAALRSLGHSYEHLCRIFTREFGIPPLRYANYSRLEKAKLLLRDPARKVSRVAEELGFSSAGYFSRVFRRYTGRTPTVFAAGLREG